MSSNNPTQTLSQTDKPIGDVSINLLAGVIEEIAANQGSNQANTEVYPAESIPAPDSDEATLTEDEIEALINILSQSEISQVPNLPKKLSNNAA